MKKFQFNLDTVLSYKQQVLDNLQNEHSVLLQRVRRQEELMEELEADYAARHREFRQAEREGITIADARAYEMGLRAQERTIQAEQKRLEQFRAEAERKREQVVAARQETAALEKLKDKKMEDYRKMVQKGEEQFIDELVSTVRVMNAGAP